MLTKKLPLKQKGGKMPESSVPLMLQLPEKIGDYFVIKVENLKGGIPCNIYNGVRESAKILATRHSDWPREFLPSDEITWNSNDSTFTIKPEEEEVDLSRTSFSGTLSVTIRDMGKLLFDSGSKEETLNFFVKHVATLLSARGGPNTDDYFWEIINFSRKNKKLVVKKKN